MQDVDVGTSLELGDIWGVIGCMWRVGAGRLTEADPRERCAVWKGWMWYECSLRASDSQRSSW